MSETTDRATFRHCLLAVLIAAALIPTAMGCGPTAPPPATYEFGPTLFARVQRNFSRAVSKKRKWRTTSNGLMSVKNR